MDAGAGRRSRSQGTPEAQQTVQGQDEGGNAEVTSGQGGRGRRSSQGGGLGVRSRTDVGLGRGGRGGSQQSKRQLLAPLGGSSPDDTLIALVTSRQ